jgi:hypothetical protein
MRLDVTTPPTTTPVSYADVKSHLNIYEDHDLGWITTFGIPAAVDFCETHTARSLITRGLTATYSHEDDPQRHVRHHRHGYYAYPTPFLGPMTMLPQGPVQSVQTVTTIHGVVLDPSTYAVRRIGTTDYLQLPINAWPVTVVYTAGYGSAPSAVPAKLRLGMLMHVAHLWDNRSATTVRPQAYVMAGLEAMYAQAVSEVTL